MPLQAGVRRLGLCLPPTPVRGVETEHSSQLPHSCLTRIARVLAIPQAASTFFRVSLLSIITALPKEQRGSTQALYRCKHQPPDWSSASHFSGRPNRRKYKGPSTNTQRHEVRAKCTSGVLYLRERDSFATSLNFSGVTRAAVSIKYLRHISLAL